jgi:hypothetical protein
MLLLPTVFSFVFQRRQQDFAMLLDFGQKSIIQTPLTVSRAHDWFLLDEMT